MQYLLFLLIIYIFNDLFILSLDCTSYSECFNCSVCGDETSNTCSCQWDNEFKNCNNGASKSLTNNFYEYFTSCSDDHSKTITQKYCGKTHLELNNDNELVISVPKNFNLYGTRNLYCEFYYKASGKKDTYYELKYEISSSYFTDLNKIFLYLKVIYNDETMTSGYFSTRSISRDFDNVKEIYIYLYFSGGVNNLPFSLKITKKGDETKLALYITIGLVILACLLCALMIYFLSKKISENARIRQRNLIQLALNRRVRQNNDASSSQNNEEENGEKIEQLIKIVLAPKVFNKKCEGDNCTICIEDFIEGKSKVSITPCQHIFHYKCLCKWLRQNVLNPKCPNCNHNLLEYIDNQKIENAQTINIERKADDIQNIEIENGNTQNLETNENRLITRNENRARRRVSNRARLSPNQNIIENGNGGNSNEIQEVVIENI